MEPLDNNSSFFFKVLTLQGHVGLIGDRVEHAQCDEDEYLAYLVGIASTYWYGNGFRLHFFCSVSK